MRKFLAGILTAAIIFTAATTGVSAAGQGRGRNFVDANKDGICDYADTNHAFTDEDGDGICDNYTAGTCRGHRTGRGNGNGCQRGRGRW